MIPCDQQRGSGDHMESLSCKRRRTPRSANKIFGGHSQFATEPLEIPAAVHRVSASEGAAYVNVLVNLHAPHAGFWSVTVRRMTLCPNCRIGQRT